MPPAKKPSHPQRILALIYRYAIPQLDPEVSYPPLFRATFFILQIGHPLSRKSRLKDTRLPNFSSWPVFPPAQSPTPPFPAPSSFFWLLLVPFVTGLPLTPLFPRPLYIRLTLLLDKFIFLPTAHQWFLPPHFVLQVCPQSPRPRTLPQLDPIFDISSLTSAVGRHLF